MADAHAVGEVGRVRGVGTCVGSHVLLAHGEVGGDTTAFADIRILREAVVGAHDIGA